MNEYSCCFSLPHISTVMNDILCFSENEDCVKANLTVNLSSVFEISSTLFPLTITEFNFPVSLSRLTGLLSLSTQIMLIRENISSSKIESVGFSVKVKPSMLHSDCIGVWSIMTSTFFSSTVNTLPASSVITAMMLYEFDSSKNDFSSLITPEWLL